MRRCAKRTLKRTTIRRSGSTKQRRYLSDKHNLSSRRSNRLIKHTSSSTTSRSITDEEDQEEEIQFTESRTLASYGNPMPLSLIMYDKSIPTRTAESFEWLSNTYHRIYKSFRVSNHLRISTLGKISI